MNMDMQFIERIPTVKEYMAMRDSAGWYPVDSEHIETGLRNSLYGVCAFQRDTLIGTGRVVGDGGIYLYIQDVIVLPEFQKRGIGMKIMNYIMKFINTNAPPGAFIGLMAAQGKEGFYRKFGFQPRPVDGPGMFMVMDGTRRKEQ